MMDLANFIAAGTILGQIGFKNFYLGFSLLALAITMVLYLSAYFLYRLKGKEE